ncbi:MAG: STAS domain-containing protein [Ardenticatenaceae bacterium]|nr:STAS domain-containing protein [Ardenticatenaceae bacterium]
MNHSDPSIIRLEGRIDAYQAPMVKSSLKDLVAKAENEKRSAWIVADLSQVNFIDSAGLSALVVGLKNARETGGSLHLFGIQHAVRIILELSWLDKAFPTFNSELEAIEAATVKETA